MNKITSAPVYKYTITVSEDALDQNGHVNNVQYVAWMQEAAVRHYEQMGGVEVDEALGATWWVHSHKVIYHAPAYAGDEIEVQTWVANLRRVRSLRRYRFTRTRDNKLLVSGETDWFFVDIKTGKPKAIPSEVAKVLTIEKD